MPTLKLTYADGDTVEATFTNGQTIQVAAGNGPIEASFATDNLAGAEIVTDAPAPAPEAPAPAAEPVAEPEHGLDPDPAAEPQA